jgi:two-component system sensor histidine kinase KdpD
MNSRRTLTIIRWLLAAGALAGIVLVYRKWLHVNAATVALSLLLLVLILAAEWGLRYAVVVSVAAAACYNFFFLPPFFTFTIADTQNWIALVAFLATSIIASRLSQRVRDEAEDARAHQRELDTLFRLSRELLQSESVAALLSSLPATVVGITSATGGYLYLMDGNRLYQAGSSSVSEIEIPHLAKLANSLAGTHREGDDFQIPLRSGVRPRGLFVLRLPQLSVETADAMASLISLALDRAQALENLARGEAAKESERLRTLMIDSITHELKTPLTSIKGAATALLSGAVAPADGQELLSIIDEESDRLNHLVSEAVEMSQLDTQQVQMHMRNESVHELVERAIEMCASIKGHPLRVEVPTSLRITVDAAFFQKALGNLLENAAKYSEAGKQIVVTAEGKENRVLISVADQGIGIEESEQSLIFERFYRARNRTSAAPGTGMGLAISRAVVQSHGGEVTVTSQPSRGSVFTISIPEGRF